MTQDKDKIQQAADALEALGAETAPAGPAQEQAAETPTAETPAAQGPAQAPPPGAPAQPAVPSAPAQPVGSSQPVPPPVPSDPHVVSVVVRYPQKPQSPRQRPAEAAGPAAAGASDKVQPPPPKLTALAQATLNRKVALRRTLIPILLSTALVMVLLGVWSVAVLAGGSDPFKGEVTFQTRYLARLMLLAWPVAIILLAGTAFLMHEVYSHYRIHQPQQSAADPKRD